MRKVTTKRICWLGLGALALGLFVAFTLVVKFVDVEQVGLSHLNLFFWQHLGANATWEKITDWLGYLTLLLALALVIWQFVQWLQRKSLRRLDRNFWAVDGVYVLIILIYLCFELVVVNYRPLLLDGELKASYPSTHTMLFATVLPLVIWHLWHYLPRKSWRVILSLLLVAVMVVGVVGRLLSGVHWFTDIVAGLIISLALNCFYLAFVVKTKEEK